MNKTYQGRFNNIIQYFIWYFNLLGWNRLADRRVCAIARKELRSCGGIHLHFIYVWFGLEIDREWRVSIIIELQ